MSRSDPNSNILPRIKISNFICNWLRMLWKKLRAERIDTSGMWVISMSIRSQRWTCLRNWLRKSSMRPSTNSRRKWTEEARISWSWFSGMNLNEINDILSCQNWIDDQKVEKFRFDLRIRAVYEPKNIFDQNNDYEKSTSYVRFR